MYVPCGLLAELPTIQCVIAPMLAEKGNQMKTLTRRQLYELVWSKPMINLAKEYGMSDRGMAKLCERNAIPVPPRGYWARITVGQKIKKPPLVILDSDDGNETVLSHDPTLEEARRVHVKTSKDDLPAHVKETIEREKLPENKIVVLKTLSTPHRIISSWIAEAKREKERWRHETDPIMLSVFAPKTQSEEDRRWQDRYRRILNALLKAIERRGLILEDDKDKDGFKVSLRQDFIRFHLYERVRQYRRPVTEDDYKEDRYLSPNQKWRQISEATGLLRVDIKAQGIWDPIRIDEAEENLLEGRLNEVMEAIIVALWKTKSWRVVKEQEEQDRWTRIQEEHRREAEIAAENKRREKLFKDVEMWRRSADLRAYVRAVQQSASDGAVALDAQDIEAWIRWALNVADNADPLLGGKVFPKKAVGENDETGPHEEDE